MKRAVLGATCLARVSCSICETRVQDVKAMNAASQVNQCAPEIHIDIACLSHTHHSFIIIIIIIIVTLPRRRHLHHFTVDNAQQPAVSRQIDK